MSEIAVVHLVRKGNDPALFERFLASYRLHDSGLCHRLFIVFKGYSEKDLPELRAEFANIEYQALVMPDKGFDISAYLFAAQAVGDDIDYMLFLNSYSEILAPGWLQKLHLPFSNPLVGATAATGSWESHNTIGNKSLLDYSPWGFYLKIAFDHFSLYPDQPLLRRLCLAVQGARIHGGMNAATIFLPFSAPKFDPFPNPHLRSNAFMLKRSLLLGLKLKPIRHKMDAYVFESGRSGLSRQLLRRGFDLLVVGRNGQVYGPDKWPDSETFWSGGQSNLLISDNRTHQYQAASLTERTNLECTAWRAQRS